MNSKAMIFDQIVKEHRDIEAMILELSKGYDKQKFRDLRLALTAHMSAEEASLYPSLSNDAARGKNAEEAHKQIRSLLSKFGLAEPVDFSTKLSALSEALREHFRTEEEMLPEARQSLDQQKVDELTYMFHETERRIVERMK